VLGREVSQWDAPKGWDQVCTSPVLVENVGALRNSSPQWSSSHRSSHSPKVFRYMSTAMVKDIDPYAIMEQ
jgi:hypothetical protein